MLITDLKQIYLTKLLYYNCTLVFMIGIGNYPSVTNDA